ncbi:MAG TPA: 5-carboxymethyl-2-hydroxymuconate Delta-isomerase [Gammaproteobacteria bacterium]|nr:5-carboxymethyl-2-hydroxymuconate Delta-isomerase [Gammaproteobacteria bacterium]
MPHLTIEYSANIENAIDVERLLDRLYETALATGVFPLGGIRVRAVRVDRYRIADCAPENGFVHVTAQVGAGRTVDVLEQAGRRLFEALTSHLKSLYDRSPLAISLNIQEFHPVLNFKQNNLHEHVKRRQAGGHGAAAPSGGPPPAGGQPGGPRPAAASPAGADPDETPRAGNRGGRADG